MTADKIKETIDFLTKKGVEGRASVAFSLKDWKDIEYKLRAYEVIQRAVIAEGKIKR